MSEVPAWLRGGQETAPKLLVPKDPPKPKPEKAPRPQFSFTPEVNAPAIRRSGTQFIDPPWLLQGTPREVQIEALRRSIKGFALLDGADGVERFRILRPSGYDNRGFNYFMEMRLGKTYTILNDFYIQRWNTNVRWLVVIVPNFLKQQWENEARSVGVDIPILQFDSANRRSVTAAVDANLRTGGVLIVNYEALNSKETEALIAKIAPIAMFAADESIKLKNPNGVQFAAAERLSRAALRSVNASGKPITQGPQDLYGQLRFAHMDKGWRYPSFVAHFSEKGGYKGKVIQGVKNEDELRKLYLPRSFVARFRDWYHGFGAEYAEPRWIELAPAQQAMMAQLEKDMMTEIECTAITAEQILVRNMKMQQVRSGFIFDNEGSVHTIVPPEKNPLVQELLRVLREEVTDKVIVVGYYKETMNMLTEQLAEFNPAIIRSAEWHKKNCRPVEGEKDRFNNDPGSRVMLAQESNLLYGHTVMGTSQDPVGTMIFFEQTHSLNDRSQSEKRPQGVSQQYPINMIDFFASRLDRERVLALQRKEDVAAVILNFARSEGILPHSV